MGNMVTSVDRNVYVKTHSENILSLNAVLYYLDFPFYLAHDYLSLIIK